MKIYYHDDLDGKCAASVVCNYYRHNFPPADISPDDFIRINYDNAFSFATVDNGEPVWFVDLSFDEKNATLIKTCLIDTGSEVTWIDHHRTSIQTQELPGFEWLKDVPGLRCSHDTFKKDGAKVNFSGAALTYLYCALLKYPPDLREQMMNGTAMYDHNLLPDYIKYVSDYDCWAFNYDPKTTFFKLGMETTPSDPSASKWILLDEDKEYVDYVITTGQAIKDYIDTSNDELREECAYETTIDGHTCITINRASNSWIFGSLYDRYPLCMVWYFNGEKYKFSLFSNCGTVDCSEIAKSYGGGGHKGAAGFYLDEMPFLRTGEPIKT